MTPLLTPTCTVFRGEDDTENRTDWIAPSLVRDL
jgi:hypothetical protein